MTGSEESREKKDIQKENEDSRIPEEEYRELICPEEQYDSWKCQKKQTEKELNQAVEKNVSLGEQLGVLKHQIETNMKNLKKGNGFDQPVDRKTITDINFEERWNLQEYDLRTELQKQSRLQERNIQLSAQVAVVAEYEDEMLPEAKNAHADRRGARGCLDCHPGTDSGYPKWRSRLLKRIRKRFAEKWRRFPKLWINADSACQK